VGDALSAASSLGSTAFGVVSNVASTAALGAAKMASGVISGTALAASKTSTLLGGVLNKGMAAASSAMAGMVGMAGNVIGGLMSSSSSKGDSTPDTVKQMSSATNAVRNAGVMASSLNSAASTVMGGIEVANKVAASVQKAGGSGAQAVGGIGQLVGRMTT
jgi:hypothetical protein